MKKRLVKIVRSFKSKILLSFFAFIRIFILWICIYFFINKKQNNLDLFTNHLTSQQNLYGQSNRALQDFLLTGYHEPVFYITGKQKDIALFDECQDTVLKDLEQLKEEASQNHIKIGDQLEVLTQLHKELIDTVKLLKQLYVLKGFKDFGAEGNMRKYAHFLEDSCPILKVDILMLRRREKDFLLREDPKYIDRLNGIADTQIIKFSKSPVTKQAIQNYKAAFNDFARYTQRLGIHADNGVYSHTRNILDQLDRRYKLTNAKMEKEISSLNIIFKIILIVTFIILVVAAIYLSIILTNDLTKDIKKLKKNVDAFVSSGFKEDQDNPLEPLASKISEVQGLNEDFMHLKEALKQTLADLENSIKEEKIISGDLGTTITNLSLQLTELEHQKQQAQRSGYILDVFLQNIENCLIVVGENMAIISHNKAATDFVKVQDQKGVTIGSNILDYLEEPYVYKFTTNFKAALAGKTIHELYRTNNENIWDTSFLPVAEPDGSIFAVLFSAKKQM